MLTQRYLTKLSSPEIMRFVFRYIDVTLSILRFLLIVNLLKMEMTILNLTHSMHVDICLSIQDLVAFRKTVNKAVCSWSNIVQY